MKKIVLTICLLFAFVQYALADGKQTFTQAHIFLSQGKFSQAKTNFTLCLNDPEYATVKDNITGWISQCDFAIQEQKRNAQIAAERRKRKLAEKKNNQYCYISVVAPENIREYVKSMASEVLVKNKISECQKLEDAWTVVIVSLNIHSHEPINGFYAAEGEGFVSVGYADETKSSGFRAVDALSQSPAGQAEAERLVRNKLNHKLAHKLDNLINGRPETERLLEQIIALDLIKPETMELTTSHLCNVMNSYISKKEGVKLTSALNVKQNEARDRQARIASTYLERDERPAARELKGYSQTILIEIEESGGYLIFNASLQEINGIVITSVALDGSKFGITKESFKKVANQEMVAKMLVAWLGFGAYEVGDVAYIDDRGREVRFASVNGMHGTLFLNPTKYDEYPIAIDWNGTQQTQYTLAGSIGVDQKEGWRLPSVRELKCLGECKQFRLNSVYWTSEPAEKRCYKVVDFRYSTPVESVYKEKRQRANIVAIREF